MNFNKFLNIASYIVILIGLYAIYFGYERRIKPLYKTFNRECLINGKSPTNIITIE